MERKIRVVQYGCGRMSRWLMRYVLDHDGDLVGAFCRNAGHIGKDIAEIIGDGREKTGILVHPASRAEAELEQLKPDVCIVATRSTIAEIEEIVGLCCKLGINVLTTCEEAIFPWNSSPELSREINRMAEEGNCTITGVGNPDVYSGTLVTTLAGSVNKIEKIYGCTIYNVEDYGAALAEGHGVGLSQNEFEVTLGQCNKKTSDELQLLIEKGEFSPSYMWNQNGWLCSRLGLHPISQIQRCIPCISEKDLYSNALKKKIEAGKVTGMRAIVTTKTEEGIEIETECIGKLYEDGDNDRTFWTITGEPGIHCAFEEPASSELTCAILVNRIPQVINAPAGFITTDQYPGNIYLARPMNEYVL